eukprot:NODE_4824_length_756_cov_17.893918_g4472_i0.p1 GENE.NODE_4824_length_756_cov_17.893918_g4472_i0~~NODE_4824_length_756_cov_17.893918_g4472_i0.p1  ORF type:complete len:207 (-),score=45.84 NODE_4824_length_756_cov_17.893918_g4472_i0:136-708(-)
MEGSSNEEGALPTEDTSAMEQIVASSVNGDEEKPADRGPDSSAATATNAEAGSPTSPISPDPLLPTSKEKLLQLDGIDRDSAEIYIPSYFRKKVNSFEAAEFSTLTLGSLQNKMRDLSTSGHQGPPFQDVVSQRLAKLSSLCTQLRRDPAALLVRFRPGLLPEALDGIIAELSDEIARRSALSASASQSK